MTYNEAIEYIHSVEWRGSRPGLTRIRELCAMLGNPEDRLRFVHVAGTNGKGSFSCMLASVLTRAGYKTGLFTSPYVKSFCERMKIDGADIDAGELARVTEKVKICADLMADPPTEFELITAIAFTYFADAGVDIVVLEVGMGGRLDSTNIIKTPVLSVICEISLDHTAILGKTVPEIAAEKAGIIKNGVPVLYFGADTSALEVIKNQTALMQSSFYTPEYGRLTVKKSGVGGSLFDYRGKTGYKIKLAGLYQPKNAAAVISAVEILNSLGYNISEDALRRGLEETVWHARFELLRRNPLIIYDGGHNPQGVRACFDSIASYFPGKRITVLSGVMADKAYGETVATASAYAARAFTVKPDNPRALDAEDYAEVFRENNVDAIACDTVLRGCSMAIADAGNCDRPLLIFGSLYMYADVVSAIDRILPQ